MTDMALQGSLEPALPSATRPNLDKGFNPLTMILFFGALAGGLLYVAYSLYVDVDATGAKITTYLPFVLLFVALLIALGFEFVNGFHVTASAGPWHGRHVAGRRSRGPARQAPPSSRHR